MDIQTDITMMKNFWLRLLNRKQPTVQDSKTESTCIDPEYWLLKVLEKHLGIQISELYRHNGQWFAMTGYGVHEVSFLLKIGKYDVSAHAAEELEDMRV